MESFKIVWNHWLNAVYRIVSYREISVSLQPYYLSIYLTDPNHSVRKNISLTFAFIEISYDFP